MERVRRLGLEPLWHELETILTGFDLLLEERRDANGAAEIRSLIDGRFRSAGGWQNKQSGDIDWIKCYSVNGTHICLGVELQFSGRWPSWAWSKTALVLPLPSAVPVRDD